MSLNQIHFPKGLSLEMNCKKTLLIFVSEKCRIEWIEVQYRTDPRKQSLNRNILWFNTGEVKKARRRIHFQLTCNSKVINFPNRIKLVPSAMTCEKIMVINSICHNELEVSEFVSSTHLWWTARFEQSFNTKISFYKTKSTEEVAAVTDLKAWKNFIVRWKLSTARNK